MGLAGMQHLAGQYAPMESGMLHALINSGTQYAMKKYLDVLDNPPGIQHHAVLELVGWLYDAKTLLELLQALMDCVGTRHAAMSQVRMLPLIGLVYTSLVLLFVGLIYAGIGLLENAKNVEMDLAGLSTLMAVVDQTPAEDVAGVTVLEVGFHTDS